jgi:hypothetical protein
MNCHPSLRKGTQRLRRHSKPHRKRYAHALHRQGAATAPIAIGIMEGAWDPSFKELEAALEEEMRQYGTLENPFTHEYLERLLRENGFAAINRYVSVNGFIPACAGGLPLQTIASPAHARNDVIARKPATPDAREWDVSIEILEKNTLNDGSGFHFAPLLTSDSAAAVIA